MKRCFVGLAFVLAFFAVTPIFSQTDTIFFKSKDLIIGDIKSMDRGVIIIATPYSKDDFRIKWAEVDRIITKAPFIITTTDGIRTYGNVIGSESGKVIFKPEKSVTLDIQLDKVIGISEV